MLFNLAFIFYLFLFAYFYFCIILFYCMNYTVLYCCVVYSMWSTASYALALNVHTYYHTCYYSDYFCFFVWVSDWVCVCACVHDCVCVCTHRVQRQRAAGQVIGFTPLSRLARPPVRERRGEGWMSVWRRRKQMMLFMFGTHPIKLCESQFLLNSPCILIASSMR